MRVTAVTARWGTGRPAGSTDLPVRVVRARLLRWLAAIGAVSVLTAACGSGASQRGSDTTGDTGDEDFSGYVRDPLPDVSGVALPGADGTPVRMVADPGGLLLVYFGYTYCPDVCPTTMSDVKRALASLPAEDRNRVRVDMVTIDPDRDTAEKLTEYVTTFVPTARALRTDDQEALRAAARAFGADYKVTAGPDGEPEVSHTAELYAVDDTGRIVMIWPFGTTYEDLGSDLARLLAGERPPSTRQPEPEEQQ